MIVQTDPRAPRVVLVGPPGAGKSTIGRKLAKELGVDLYDTDAGIERETGRTIPEIFAADGEPEFRRIEERVVRRAILAERGVVSLGGGAVLSKDTRALLRNRTVVYLEISVAEGLRRTGASNQRPLLNGDDPGAKYRELMRKRRPLYREVATVRVRTDGRSPGRVVRMILDKLGLEPAAPSADPEPEVTATGGGTGLKPEGQGSSRSRARRRARARAAARRAAAKNGVAAADQTAAAIRDNCGSAAKQTDAATKDTGTAAMNNSSAGKTSTAENTAAAEVKNSTGVDNRGRANDTSAADKENGSAARKLSGTTGRVDAATKRSHIGDSGVAAEDSSAAARADHSTTDAVTEGRGATGDRGTQSGSAGRASDASNAGSTPEGTASGRRRRPRRRRPSARTSSGEPSRTEFTAPAAEPQARSWLPRLIASGARPEDTGATPTSGRARRPRACRPAGAPNPAGSHVSGVPVVGQADSTTPAPKNAEPATPPAAGGNQSARSRALRRAGSGAPADPTARTAAAESATKTSSSGRARRARARRARARALEQSARTESEQQ
ncbi:shikimate kinase [Nocardia bhagyanarayanae]|uniref:Shikimate kinase n=1 Tax=Nocardia bhagyanarayanae TaxID=1215925 RepID=A0A543FD91_9NOCA|nr:shikimate kinase [Nocardia bhagyanarayanae]